MRIAMPTAFAMPLSTRFWRWMFPLAATPGILALSLLGAVCGIVAGLSIWALHWLIDGARFAFTALNTLCAARWPDLPAALVGTALGATVVGLLLHWARSHHRHGGLVHIVERLQYHQGQLPWPNALLYLIGTTFAVGSGQVVGREGAAAHLGAAGGSLLGRWLELPNSTVRALVGCGAAAGIAASFNTPLAGVIFAMEVIVMEYTVTGLAPTIIAAVSANAVAHLWLDSHTALSVPSVALESLREIPLLLIFGGLIGIAAAVYCRAISQIARRVRRWPIWLAMALTGVLTGLVASQLTNLGDGGFATINRALAGDLSMSTAAALGVAVMVCSCLAIASAIPGGVILPSMLAGALLGSALGQFSLTIGGANAALYALLGLGAMMGAVLQAPLTALIVILELSAHTEMVFPAMLTVITAVLVSRQFSGSESLVAQLLNDRGLNFRNDPVSQSLRRISVISAMNRKVLRAPNQISLPQAQELLNQRPDWLLVQNDDAGSFAISAADVQHALNLAQQDTPAEDARLTLNKIPADRRQSSPIYLRASLQEAWDSFETTATEALHVERPNPVGESTIYGILTRKAIDKAYRP